MIAPNHVFVRKAHRTPSFIANRSWPAKMLKSDRLLGLLDGAFIWHTSVRMADGLLHWAGDTGMT